jgi:hypothetical protein
MIERSRPHSNRLNLRTQKHRQKLPKKLLPKVGPMHPLMKNLLWQGRQRKTGVKNWRQLNVT